jgi:hypothetical protein
MAENMTQEEVDALLNGYMNGEVDVDQSSLLRDSAGLSKLRRDVDCARNRYIFRLECGGNKREVAYARYYLKKTAHRYWLKSHGFYSRGEFEDWLEKNIIWDTEGQRWVKKGA